MDSVPYEFCEDVFGRIDATRAAYREYADLLTALWREAARTCAEKIWRFSIDIWKDGEQWMCNLQDWDRADEEEGPISIDQLVAMDRRWIRVMSVEVGAGVDDETSFEVSKEDISQKLIPFLNRQSLHCCSFQIWIHSTYDASEYLDIFQKYVAFGHLQLKVPRYCAQMEEFMEAQVQNNSALKFLTLQVVPTEPYTMELKYHLIQLLARNIVGITIYHELEMKLLKAAFDAWEQTEKELHVTGRIGVTQEEVLALAFPENIIRTEGAFKEHGRRLVVRWTKENGLDFTCNFDYNTRRLYLDTGMA